MNSARIVAAIAAFVLFFGLGQLAIASAPNSVDHAFTVPAGAYYYHIDFGYLLAAPVSLTYTVTSSGNVLVYLLTDAQFAAYRAGGGLAALTSSDSNSGSLSFDVPSGGTYHVVVRHAADSTSLNEDVSVTISYSGIAPNPFYLGLGSLAFAVLLLLVASRMRRRRRGLPRSPQETAESRGVTYFEPPKPPPPSPPRNGPTQDGPPTQPTNVLTAAFCVNCGVPMEPGHRFCVRCGAPAWKGMPPSTETSGPKRP